MDFQQTIETHAHEISDRGEVRSNPNQQTIEKAKIHNHCKNLES